MTESSEAAVITGAGRGIGRAVALELVSRGYPVALQGRSVEPLRETEAAVRAAGGRAHVVPGDVTDPSAADALLAECAEALGTPRVVVAAAGQAFSAPLARTEAEGMRRLLEVNLMGVFHLLRAAAPVLKDAGGGRFVAIASTAAVKGMRYTAAYSASKHAVLGLVRSAALELASSGVTVNAVCPGWVDTPMFEATLKNIVEKTGGTLDVARGRIEKMVPLGRVLTPEEVARMVAYVVGPDAGHLTGQALVLDGGETIA
jgi:NAD(P)-dependent dehydrogenase (short-subunit alcohol dehydrogenase family)